MVTLILAPIFVAPGDYSLQEPSVKLTREELLSESVQSEIDGLLQIARGERQDLEKRVMVGLAAPQVGICKRIILVDMGVGPDRKNLGELAVFVNPEIMWHSKDNEIGREGCFSVDSHVCGLVSRAPEIRITAWDRFGNLVEKELSGFTARIFQHELDHLNGIRFPDRVGPEGILHWVEESEYPDYRNNYENWSTFCPWEKWVAMKSGEFK